MGRQPSHRPRPKNWHKSLVTFSKRKTNLIEKAKVLSASYNIDIAIVDFSPADCSNMHCSQASLQDLLQGYIDLPADKRNCHITNVEEKVNRLKQLDHIDGYEEKLQFLDNHIKHMEQLVRRSEIELEVTEACLRDYEADPKYDQSPAELLLCEENLTRSLYHVTEKKYQMEMETQYVGGPFPYSHGTGSTHYMKHRNLIINSNSFHGSVGEASSSHGLNLTVPGFSVSPFQQSTPVQSHASLMVHQFYTQELSYYSSNQNAQQTQFLIGARRPQFPAIGGSSSSYRVPNTNAPLLIHKQSSVFPLESQQISQNLSQLTPGPFFDNSGSSNICVGNASGAAATANEYEPSNDHNDQVNPTADGGPGNFDRSDLLSIEAIMEEMASAHTNGAVDQEGIGSWELDGYALAEDLMNMNDDIEIVF